jgi:hypothetical protein
MELHRRGQTAPKAVEPALYSWWLSTPSARHFNVLHSRRARMSDAAVQGGRQRLQQTRTLTYTEFGQLSGPCIWYLFWAVILC